MYAQEVNYCKLDEKARPVMDSPRACAMELVLRYLRLDDKTVASRETVAAGLQSMGYRLQEGELDRLCSSIGGSADSLSRAAVIASQIDWRYMQRHQKERWLALARRAFDNIDVDRTGRVSVDEMLSALHVRASTPPVFSSARNIRCGHCASSRDMCAPVEHRSVTAVDACRTRCRAGRCRRCTRS